jgi:hypothetical protein
MLVEAKKHGVRIYSITGVDECQTFRSQMDSVCQRCLKAGIEFNLKIMPGMTHEVPLDFQSQFLTAWNWVRPAQQAAGGKVEWQSLR